MMSTVLIILCACSLDALLGEPKRFHPLIGYGRFVRWIEYKSYHASRLAGIFATLVVLFIPLSFTWIIFSFSQLILLNDVLSILILYLAIARKSLLMHALAVYKPLKLNNIYKARLEVSKLVSRQTKNLTAAGIIRATIESILENGSDALFAPLFWYCLTGPVGVLLYRCVNTLDAMWGYRNKRYSNFGWAAARLDDCMNFFPALLTACAYLALSTPKFWLSYFVLCIKQGRNWKSFNAGIVMSAGALYLQCRLGGLTQYKQGWVEQISLGKGAAPELENILQANQLINHALILWLIVIILINF